MITKFIVDKIYIDIYQLHMDGISTDFARCE